MTDPLLIIASIACAATIALWAQNPRVGPRRVAAVAMVAAGTLAALAGVCGDTEGAVVLIAVALAARGAAMLSGKEGEAASRGEATFAYRRDEHVPGPKRP